MSTGSSRSGFAEFLRDLRLPESLRGRLQTPMGPVLTGDALRDRLGECALVAAIGDYCTADLLAAGVDVRVAVIDRLTKRAADERAAIRPELARFARIPVTNPAATVSRESWAALEQAFKTAGPVLLEVRGEEDLLALPAIALAPEGSCVVYGQPDEGAVVVRVDGAAKDRVRDILARME